MINQTGASGGQIRAELVHAGGSGETHILNKVADNGIVEIFDVGPLDAL